MLSTAMGHKGGRPVNDVGVDPVNRFDERAATMGSITMRWPTVVFEVCLTLPRRSGWK